jgi:glycosyltransferase involved in cell wall biosynthesis
LTKITLYTPELGGGGAQKTIQLIGRVLYNLNYDVSIVYNHEDQRYTSKLASPYCNYIELNSSRTLFSIPKLFIFLIRSRPRFVLSTQPHASIAIGLIIVVLQFFFKIELICREANLQKEEKKVSKLYIYVLRKVAVQILALSDDAKNDLLEFGVQKNKITVVPNIVQCSDNIENINKIHSIDAEYTIAFIGRFDEMKGIFQTIVALKNYDPKAPVLNLHVFGDGPLHLRIHEETKKLGKNVKIHFYGWVDNAFSMLTSDIPLIVPSRYEPFGHIYLEACCYGVPIIARDGRGGSRDVVKNFDVGITYQSDEELISMIHDFRNTILKAKEKLINRDKVLDYFSNKNITKKYSRFMEILDG